MGLAKTFSKVRSVINQIMLSPGALLLRFRTKYKHGFATARWRDRVRPTILKTPPVAGADARHCEIHVLTSADDHLNLMWALKSFYRYSGRQYALAIHDDGSLTDAIRATLCEHFPDARLISHQAARENARELLKNHPRCLEFRLTNHLSPKLFDFPAHLQSERMLLLDSDVLFFREPTELLARIENPDYRLNSTNRDVSEAATVSAEIVRERCGVELMPRFNSGLGLIFGESLNLDWIEEFLGLPDILGHFWRIEQTLYALCSSRWGTELLPSDYDVRLDAGAKGLPVRHYVGAIRHLMYREGLKQLVAQGFLKTR